MKGKVLYRDESCAIMGACFNVYNEKGCGFSEELFQECLEIEFMHLGIHFMSQPEMTVTYRGRELKKRFRPDFTCFGKIVVELKALSAITSEHRAQVINYLKATGFELGLLINFGHYPRLEYERLVLTEDRSRPRVARLGDDDSWRLIEF